MTDELGRLDPHDIDAERGVLGAMMLSAAQAEKCRELLDPDDFFRPFHQLLFSMLASRSRVGLPTDVIPVKAALDETGERYDPLYLVGLVGMTLVVANGENYARIVRDRAVRRRLLVAGRRIIQWADPGFAPDEDAWGLAERARAEVERVLIAGSADGITVEAIGAFMSRVAAANQTDYDWVVPDLLERGDRLVLTGFEGCGKSTLLRQFAVTIAAGLHPLTQLPTAPKRVLVIDAENEAVASWRELRPLLNQARLQHAEVLDENLYVQCCGRRNLLSDKDVSWLLRQVGAVQPDVTVLGPLYKLAIKAINSDDEAAVVLAVLDMIRAKGSCVLLEAHSGHTVGPGGLRDPRPRGSSALLGWPEFGYGLRWSKDPQASGGRCVDMVPWRGGRDAGRVWPELLLAGGKWPWRIGYRAKERDGELW